MPHDLGASALIAALALGITIFGFHRQKNPNNNNNDDVDAENQELEASASLRSAARETMFSSFKRRIGSFGGYTASSSSNTTTTPRSTMPSYNSESNNNTSPEPGDNHSTSASSDSGGSSSAASKTSSSLSSFMTRGNASAAATSPANASTDSKKAKKPPKTKKKKKDEIPKEWTEKVPQLANFDACVAAADALAAAPLPASNGTNGNDADNNEAMMAAGNSSLTRLDKASGLVHTSVLVSPEGTLLLVPPGMMSPDKLPLSNYFQQHSQHRQQQQQQQEQQQQQPMRLDDDDEDGHDGASPPEEEAEAAAAAETPEVPPPVEEISTPASAEAPAEESAPAADDDDARKETTDEQGREAAEEEGDDDERNHTAATAVDNTDNRSTASSTESIFSELLWNSKEEYAAAVFCGHDLDERGDLALNGFSAKGWSLPAASFAVRQAHASLEHWADFCHAIILARKESAVKTHQACDALRAQVPRLGGHNPPGVAAVTAANQPQQADDASWELVFDPKTTDFMPTARRSGPLLGGNGSLVHAVCSLEEYYSASAEAESSTWRHATVHQGAVLPQLQAAVEQLHRRAGAREQALEEASKRVRALEARVAQLKTERDKKWQTVVKAEEKVTQRMQVLRQERTRQREKARMVQLREAAANSRNNNSAGTATQQQQQHRKNQASSEQVWDMVAAISDNMDSSSFEPVHLTPRAGADPPPALVAAHSEEEAAAPADAVSREAMEAEGRLPELRAVAWQADEAIDEAASLLLQALSHLDATRRSARVAAETALLAAANAQAATLSQLVQLERAAVQERLQHLEQLEAGLQEVDVRADLHAYIAADVADLGGRSHLGDDDDGGIASALATLSRHVDVQHGEAAALDERRSEEEDDEDEIDNLLNKSISRDQVRNAVDSLFFEKPTGEALERADIEEAVGMLCRVAALEPSPRQRNRRMTLCYALNSQRSSKAALQSQPQFDGLVQVFDAVLTSCAHDDDNDDDSSRLADAKMLMMLAQTFYLPPETTTTEEPPTPTSHQGRSRRLYIKSRLTQHAIWSKDDFWDVALAQQISEALSQSGVILSNFERPSNTRAQRGGDGAFGKSRHLQWHDLSLQERVGAASQVHAVVFAQLGALAHSMLEFGCGLPRSCAFVRRMAVRHALPSAQRNMLLQHLMMAAAQQDDDNNNKEEAKHDDDDKKPHDDETKAKAPEQPVAIDTDDAS